MSWIERIATAIWPSPSGLEVDEPEAIRLTVEPPYGRVFEALDALLGPGTLLYWEGRAGPMLKVDLPHALDRCVRLHAHLNGRIVWQWRPAFSPGPMLISRRIPDYRVGEFMRALA